VLSKIEFFETKAARPQLTAERERLLPALRHHLQSSGRDVIVTPALGGTLGICFDAKISGERRFLKTHLPGAKARASLAKEADLLLRLYGKAIVLDCFEILLSDGSARLCLLMPTLAPLAAPMQPEAAAAMVRGWGEQFGNDRPETRVSFEQYLSCAARALATLSDRDLLETGSAREVRSLIAQLEDRLARLPRALSHGDFGPKNIMVRGAEPLAIDWEDAFWGIAGYDYLYWLTFMENRPFLQSAAFGRTALGPDVERAILVLVVLLKSYLAVCSGAYLDHAVAVQARIAEILDLPN
jgi:Phosphotransferase enzyme family